MSDTCAFPFLDFGVLAIGDAECLCTEIKMMSTNRDSCTLCGRFFAFLLLSLLAVVGCRDKTGGVSTQLELGSMYLLGAGVQTNDDEAVKWLRKAAEQGDPIAQFNFGAMYATGNGVEQSMEQAAQWTSKAANQG